MDKVHEDLQFCLDRAAMAQRASDVAAEKGDIEGASEWLRHVEDWNELIADILEELNTKVSP